MIGAPGRLLRPLCRSSLSAVRQCADRRHRGSGLTGASYLAGSRARPKWWRPSADAHGVPLVTAGLAVVLAFRTLGARRIGLVSPYPEGLNQASIGYWEEPRPHGRRCCPNRDPLGSKFHPIYSIPAANAEQGLDQLAAKSSMPLSCSGPECRHLSRSFIGRASAARRSCHACSAWPGPRSMLPASRRPIVRHCLISSRRKNGGYAGATYARVDVAL